MGRVVANEFKRARVFARDELDPGVFFDSIPEIGKLAIERHRDRALGERGRDALRDVETGDVVGIFAARAVGKGQGDHGRYSYAHSHERAWVSGESTAV